MGQSIMSCPASCNFLTVMSMALATGGNGLIMLLDLMIAKDNFAGSSIDRHGIGATFGSINQGFESTMTFEYSLISLGE